MVAASTGSVLSFFYSFQFGDFSGGGLVVLGPSWIRPKARKNWNYFTFFLYPFIRFLRLLGGPSPLRTRCPCFKSNSLLPCFPPPLFFLQKVIFFGTRLWRLWYLEIRNFSMNLLLNEDNFEDFSVVFDFFDLVDDVLPFSIQKICGCALADLGFRLKGKILFTEINFFPILFFTIILLLMEKNTKKHVLFGVKTNCLIFCIFFPHTVTRRFKEPLSKKGPGKGATSLRQRRTVHRAGGARGRDRNICPPAFGKLSGRFGNASKILETSGGLGDDLSKPRAHSLWPWQCSLFVLPLVLKTIH